MAGSPTLRPAGRPNSAQIEHFWLHSGVVANGEPLPDYLFSITPWIAGSFTFGGQNWWGNFSSADGKLTETIEAVQAIPPFVRRFRAYPNNRHGATLWRVFRVIRIGS